MVLRRENCKNFALNLCVLDIIIVDKKTRGEKISKDKLLKPCPFCGAQPVINKRENGTWEIRCINEYCGVLVMTDEKISKELAIKTWNTRALNKVIV